MKISKSLRKSRFIKRYKKRSLKKGSLKRIVNRLIQKNIETKHQMVGYTEQALTSAATYPGTYQDGAMNIAQGITNLGRIGNIIKGIGWGTRWVLHNNATDPQFIRYLVLVNKQGSSNSDYTTGTALFDNTSGTNTNLSTFTTNAYLVRRINKDKYFTIVDKIIKLGGTSDKDKIYAYKTYIRLSRKFNYDGTSGMLPTLGNIIEIWLTAEGDDDSVGQTVELTGEQQFWYKDA